MQQNDNQNTSHHSNVDVEVQENQNDVSRHSAQVQNDVSLISSASPPPPGPFFHQADQNEMQHNASVPAADDMANVFVPQRNNKVDFSTQTETIEMSTQTCKFKNSLKYCFGHSMLHIL